MLTCLVYEQKPSQELHRWLLLLHNPPDACPVVSVCHFTRIESFIVVGLLKTESRWNLSFLSLKRVLSGRISGMVPAKALWSFACFFCFCSSIIHIEVGVTSTEYN